MQYLFSLAFIIVSLFSTSVMAEDVEGKIRSIDEANETITLDDNKRYQLPDEFDYSFIKLGMKVIILYDQVDDVRYVTDLQDAP
ncbi:DUF1344 domain-containing protein [Paenochrobactrum glaciei]|uniref:DUF1344 domain-containing protein n=1 Tax=Paenochrobactrum glaciei TaxID=486407 RepID=A0ABN1FKI4_9HYPH